MDWAKEYADLFDRTEATGAPPPPVSGSNRSKNEEPT
jgi:hypothetical protein